MKIVLFGNKGVVCQIVSPDDMPVTEDGLRVQVLIPSASYIARSIPGQLNKSVRWYGSKLAKYIEHNKSLTLKDKVNLVTGFYNEVNEEHVNAFHDLISAYGAEQAVDFFVEPGKLKKTIQLCINSFSSGVNIKTPLKLHRFCLRNGINVDKDTVYLKGVPLLEKFEVIDIFMIRLKQSPIDKASMRSRGAEDAKGLLCKTKDKQNGTEIVGTTPTRFGAMELILTASFLTPETFMGMFRPINNPSIDIYEVYMRARGINVKKDYK